MKLASDDSRKQIGAARKQLAHFDECRPHSFQVIRELLGPPVRLDSAHFVVGHEFGVLNFLRDVRMQIAQE